MRDVKYCRFICEFSSEQSGNKLDGLTRFSQRVFYFSSWPTIMLLCRWLIIRLVLIACLPMCGNTEVSGAGAFVLTCLYINSALLSLRLKNKLCDMDVCLAVEYIHKTTVSLWLIVCDFSVFFFLYSVYLAVSNPQWMLSVGRRDSHYTRISRMPLRCKLCSGECSTECCPVLSYLLFGKPSPGISHSSQSAHCCSAEDSPAPSVQICLTPNPHSELWMGLLLGMMVFLRVQITHVL